MPSPRFIRSSNGATVDDALLRAPRSVAVGGVRYPRDIFDKWSDAELAALGYFRVTAGSLPAEHLETGRSYVRQGDMFVETIESRAATDVERAANIALPRAVFFLALDQALGLTAADPVVDQFVANAVSASTTLDEATKRTALTLLRGAVTFLRVDPDAPGLLDALGAELGMTPAQIDALFISAADAEGAT